MATQASLDQIQNLYIAFYGRPADVAGQTFWADELEAANGDLSAIINAFASSDEYQRNYGDLEPEALVNALYQQILGRDAEQEGLDFYVGELAEGNITEGEIALAILNGVQGDDAAVLENRKAVADAFTATVEAEGKAYEGQAAEDAARALLEGVGASTNPADVDIAGTVAGFENEGSEPGQGTEGETFTLTDGRDMVTGTDGDDTFIGLAGQNQNGAIANAFATGDYIDGGEGRDAVEASLLNDYSLGNTSNDDVLGNLTNAEAVAPRTENVEEVYLEVLDETVLVDAGRMNSVEQYWSDNSDNNLIIEDVRLGDKLSATKDITFGLRDVDTDAGLFASFDTNSLVNEGTSNVNSQLLVRIADVTTATPAAPLSNVEVTVGFTFNGENVLLENIQSTDGTYTGLRQAIDAALDAKGLTGLVVTLDNPYNQVTIANNTVDLPFTAQEVLITDPAGKAFTDVTFEYNSVESVNEEFLVAGNAAPVEPGTRDSLIETNVVLDNAGRGSTAGDVVIGGMSNSDEAIEKLNLIVDRNSKVDDVTSIVDTEGQGWGEANRVAFDQIEVTSGAAQGDLEIGSIGDAKQFDSTAFQGENLAVAGEATSIDAYAYSTSGSNDTITIDYNGDLASEYAGFSLGVSTSGGDDVVTLVSDFGTENDLSNQQDLDNITVNTGSGDDVVSTFGAGRVSISTEGGNDTVYSDNSGSTFEAAVYDLGLNEEQFNALANDNGQVHAHWTLFGQDNNILDMRGYDVAGSGNAQNAVLPGAIAPMLLEGAQVKITLSDAFGVMQTASTDAAAELNGLEAVAEIQTENGFATHADINAAIIEAINASPVLSKLLEAEAGPDNTLVIRSLIDGEFSSEDIQLDILAGNATDATADNFIGNAALSDLASDLKADSDANDLTAAQLQALLDAGEATAQGWIDGANGTFGLATAGVATGTAAVNEEQTLTITADDTDDGNETLTVTFGTDAAAATADVIVNLGAIDVTDATAVATAVSDALNADGTFSGLATATADADVVTITYNDTTNIDTDVSAVAGGTTNGLAGAGANVANGAPAVADNEITGTASGAESDNVINLGGDNDVLVLSTGANSNETIVLEDSFGHNTIVNFDDATYGTGSGDQLDLSAYLTARTSTSGSEESSVVDATVVADVAEGDLETALENNVNTVVNFTGVAFTAEDTWADLTGDVLEAALSGGADYAGINTDILTNFAQDANLYSAAHQSVVFIENAANQGEYKVFDLAIAEGSLEISLVGTVDFGESITFNAGNFA
ncbi:DUF4214 domain-containing protein [Marinobacterium weihaiense]|uniref:DUF4214 domain-containing protein n=1 Tax=Marinobacterium weihaiense TaxID=2851016 RepID=A0ABS6M7X8_9GAMM|nr:DUF4214 domain-containing protein [Marinobacterium weihaiense]MBV0932295.1 DUF4214 domain-containing protein [Marinobacterium weihaiense]